MLYSLVFESGRYLEAYEALEQSLADAVTPDRATWGRLPAQQAAMRRAQGEGQVQ